MTINFISSNDSNGTRIMHIKRDNIEIMIGIETDGIIEELCDSFLQKNEVNLFLIVLNYCIANFIK